MKDIVLDVIKNNNCVGCGLCSKFFKNCYGMTLSTQGYYRPQKFKDNNNIILEDEFKKICPGYIRRTEMNDDSNLGIWGKYQSIMTTYATDSSIRYRASTGGTITAILLYLIENNFIDAVINVKTNNKLPYISQYEISKKRKEIIETSGSKYEPSFLFSQLNTIKNFNGKLAVVAKPCEIAALKRYVNLYNLSEKIYCYITFLCGGVPSLNATLDILKENKIDKATVSNIQYRGDGWPGYFKVKYENNKEFKLSYLDSWSKKLSKKIQPACKICTDGIGEMADIVLGDAWNLDSNGKINLEESDGINITISRTQLGKKIVEKAIQENYLKVIEKNLSEKVLNKMQPYHILRRKNVYYRILGKKLLLKKVPKYNKKLFKRFSKKEPLLRKVKSILYSIKQEIRDE